MPHANLSMPHNLAKDHAVQSMSIT